LVSHWHTSGKEVSVGAGEKPWVSPQYQSQSKEVGLFGYVNRSDSLCVCVSASVLTAHVHDISLETDVYVSRVWLSPQWQKAEGGPYPWQSQGYSRSNLSPVGRRFYDKTHSSLQVFTCLVLCSGNETTYTHKCYGTEIFIPVSRSRSLWTCSHTQKSQVCHLNTLILELWGCLGWLTFRSVEIMSGPRGPNPGACVAVKCAN
jgi:hypothetical protein